LAFAGVASAAVSSDLSKLVAGDAAASDRFGHSVAVADGVLVAGAPYDDDASGSAYVFVRDVIGVWLQKQKLVASDAAAGDYFGQTVAVSDGVVVFGALGDDHAGSDSGSAYVFVSDGNGIWSQEDKLVASDAAAGDRFGSSVAVSDGVVVVASETLGSVYVFVRDVNGVWSQDAKLVASDAAAGDRFGHGYSRSVAVSEGVIVVGAYKDDDGGSNTGSAYVFVRDVSGVWSQDDKLVASDAAAADYFGSSVAVSDGVVVVGSHGDDHAGLSSGAAYVFSGPAPKPTALPTEAPSKLSEHPCTNKVWIKSKKKWNRECRWARRRACKKKKKSSKCKIFKRTFFKRKF
jgi:hypothetical protein